MESSLLTQDLVVWVLSLALGIPILILVLGELSERLERQNNPLAPGVRYLRHMVLPALAVLFIMRHILGIDGSEHSVRLVETIFWGIVVYAVFILIRQLTQLGVDNPNTWPASIPPLFFALCRGVVIFWAMTHVLSGIWGVDLSKLTTAVGLGSMAIAFALQDTLSNLVSGFLL